MQTLSYKGKIVGQFRTKAEALVYCFGNGLVYDRFSPKRNQLIQGVKIDGVDDLDANIPDLPIHPLDRESIQRDRELGATTSDGRSSKGRSLPMRGPLDDRGRNDLRSPERHLRRRRWL